MGRRKTRSIENRKSAMEGQLLRVATHGEKEKLIVPHHYGKGGTKTQNL